MARVKIENGQLVISVQGLRKFFAMKNEVSVPIENVESVQTGLNWADMPRILDKIIGSNLDSFYYGGTFKEGGVFNRDGDKIFYDLKKREQAVVITLKDEEFKRLIIGVDNPDEAVEIIQQAIK